MKKAMDFDKLRKKRRRKQTIRRILVLAGLVAVVLGAVALNGMLIDAGASVRLSDWVESLGGSGYPIAHPGGAIRDLEDMGDHLAVQGDLSLYIYNKKGKLVTSIQQMTDKTVAVVTKSRVLTYQIGAESFSVNTRSQELLKRDMSFGILCGDMNEEGVVAIATSSKQYVAEVTVYNKQMDTKHLYKWSAAKDQVVDISLAPNGNQMVVACVNTSGGVIETVLYLFDFGMETPLARLDVADNLVLNVDFMEDNRIGVLTDKQYFLMDNTGAKKESYSFDGGQPVAMERSGRQVLLATEYWETRTQHVVLLDEACAPAATCTIDNLVRDMALSEDRAYLLTDDGILELDHSFQQRGRRARRGIVGMALVERRLYYIDSEEIGVYHRDDPAPETEAASQETKGASQAAEAASRKEVPQ